MSATSTSTVFLVVLFGLLQLIVVNGSGSCPKASTVVEANLAGGCDYKSLTTDTYDACEAACCGDAMCFQWNWDSNLSSHLRPKGCEVSGCCFLKSCVAHPGPTCGDKRPHCESWSGSSGRPGPTPPTPFPPCPPGEKCFYNQGTRQGVTKSFDCEVRKHAWEFAKTTLPERGDFKSAYEALQLEACGVTTPSTDDVFKPPKFATPTTEATIYVDSTSAGGGDGSRTSPFNTLEAAVGSKAATTLGPKTILLKAGMYRTTGVVLTTQHNDLTIQNFEGDAVVVSGAVAVDTSVEKWTVHNKATNTWKLDLKGQNLPTEFGMRVGSKRAIRAKYPNGDPETAASYCIIPLGSIASPGVYLPGSGVSENYPQYFPRLHEDTNNTIEYWAYPSDWPGVFWHNADNEHPKSIGGYGPYFYAAGGVCSGRSPSHGYWCAENPRGQIGQHLIDPPGGFVYGSVLPQAVNYSNPKGAIFHARGGSMPYFSYMCVVDDIVNGSVHFNHSVGCDQGGPTPTTPGKAWDWYIENVKEECDSAGEYFVDVDEQALYYTFNTSETPNSSNTEMSLTRTKVIFNISGTMQHPVKNIVIQGLTIRDAAFTYLGTTQADIHWLPSEGDWALQRSGAITIEGAKGVRVHRNQLTRCDGNGIFLGGYTRNVNITNNDLNWIGDSAMAAFGWTSECLNANCSVKLPAKVGPDGRDGEQPRGTYVGGNLVREIGIWQKQSSAWFQALATTTTIESNVFFNGPRAAVNFNDAFGGGDVVIGNLMFNMVRETVDHGTMNAWERGPYFSDIGYVEDNTTTNLKPTSEQLERGATPGFKRQQPSGQTTSAGSVVGQYRHVANNFLLGTYNVNSNLETDDGSSRYLLYKNYFVYATSATDFAMNAHWNYYVDNVYAYGEAIMAGWAVESGNAATNVYVYNGTFYMLGAQSVCRGHFNGSLLDESVVYTNASMASPSPLHACGDTATSTVKLAPPAPDAHVTAAAKTVLGCFPRPYVGC